MCLPALPNPHPPAWLRFSAEVNQVQGVEVAFAQSVAEELHEYPAVLLVRDFEAKTAFVCGDMLL
jgi:hypothetical protein